MKIFLVLGLFLQAAVIAWAETLPPLKDGLAPSTFDEMWAGFNPRQEPMEVEVLKEWEEGGVFLQVLRYRIGIFKGQKAMMAAVYGYPKGGTNLPGLVQIHGGGQYADYKAPLTNAKRGYATISIAWAGRISAPNYQVNPDVVKLFWDGKTNDPNYKVTTDWGALDAYHAPCRNPKNGFPTAQPAAWTLDNVESPRNSPWFLCALGARRALTFLEQQPVVDKNKLGVYGHSMGGKLTVMTAAADARVKAAAPSCGGISDRDNKSALFRATIGDAAQLPHIACPVFFLSPANDFHGRINDLPAAIDEIKSSQYRITSAPHHNHQDTAEYEVATQLWFDHQLKGVFQVPATPMTVLNLKTTNGVPILTISPDESKLILAVDVFYTQQGPMQGDKEEREDTMTRFWHHASTLKQSGKWFAQLPLFSLDKPLWVYANVLYSLDKPVTGAGYYYRIYTADRFNISSLMHVASPQNLRAAGIKATLRPSLIIEEFTDDWQKEWFSYNPENWARSTHKIRDPLWSAPTSAILAMEVRAALSNKLVLSVDKYSAEVTLRGGGDWNVIKLLPGDFHDAEGQSLSSWNGLKELRFGAQETLRPKKDGAKPVFLGGTWKGANPEFRNLRWVEPAKNEKTIQ